MSDKDIMSAFGGGGSGKIPLWVKLVVLGLIELVLWGATQDFGLWLTISAFFLGIGWACFLDKGNILMTLAVLVFATLLVGTSFGEPMRKVAEGIKGFGDTGSTSVGNLDIQLPTSGGTPAPAPTATSPAPPTTPAPARP